MYIYMRCEVINWAEFGVFKTFEKLSFLGLLKHHKIEVSANFCGFCCCKRRSKKDTWNFWFGFFLSKIGRFVTHICSSKRPC